MTHTLGPWNSKRASAGGREIITSEVAPLDVCVLSRHNKSPAEVNANALLIAAAPELLEALERIKATGVFLGVIPQQMMDDAIAKARGTA